MLVGHAGVAPTAVLLNFQQPSVLLLARIFVPDDAAADATHAAVLIKLSDEWNATNTIGWPVISPVKLVRTALKRCKSHTCVK